MDSLNQDIPTGKIHRDIMGRIRLHTHQQGQEDKYRTVFSTIGIVLQGFMAFKVSNTRPKMVRFVDPDHKQDMTHRCRGMSKQDQFNSHIKTNIKTRLDIQAMSISKIVRSTEDPNK